MEFGPLAFAPVDLGKHEDLCVQFCEDAMIDKSLRHPLDRSIYALGVDLIRRTQGAGAVADTHVEDYANGELSRAFGVFQDGVLVAVATANVQAYADIPVLMTARPVSDTEKTKPVGYLRTLAVAPEYQGQGLGRALTLARLNWFREMGCVGAVTVSWANGRPNSSGSLFRKLGFEMIARHERFYRDALITQNAKCLVCGDLCECAAEIFFKDL